MESFEIQVENDFPQEINTVLVSAVRRAYDTAVEDYDEGGGSNANTFGYNLYWFCVHELSMAANEASNETIKVISERPEFRMRIGSCIVACHRVGSDPEQDISMSFPNNNRAAARLARSNQEQLLFPGFEPAPSYVPPRGPNVILGHIGNPFDGVCSIHLCVPIYEENKLITRWEYTKLLWEADSIGKPISPAKDLPQEVPIEPAIIRLKPRREEKNGSDI